MPQPMKPNTKLYPFWSPETSGAAAGFANPTGLAAEILAASLGDAQRLRVFQETTANQTNVPFFQGVNASVPLPSPQMPQRLPVIPDPDNLVAQAQASIIASLTGKGR